MTKQNNRRSKAGQNAYNNRGMMWLELALFIVLNGISTLGRGIVSVFMPATGRRDGGRLSFITHTILAIVTLEGPRLMLISRYHAARMKRGTKVGISAVGGTAVAAVIVTTILVGSQLMAVTVDGKVIGYVENEGQYEALRQRAKEKISEQVGTENAEILIQDINVSLEPVLAPQQQPMTPVVEPPAPDEENGGAGDAVDGNPRNGAGTETGSPALANKSGADVPVLNGTSADSGGSVMSADVSSDAEDPAIGGEEALLDTLIDSLIGDSAIKATVYTITVNDRVMATLGTMREARDVLKAIETHYLSIDGEYTGKFMDDTKIEGFTTELADVKLHNADDVVAMLLGGTEEEKAYTVAEGDGIDAICKALGVTQAELAERYPDQDFDEIGEGDVFVATLNAPSLRYESMGEETAPEPVPYSIIEEKTTELFLGQREIRDAGEEGERLVTYFVTRVNGEIVSKAEIGSVIVIEPKTEVVLVGLKTVFSEGGDAYVGPSDGYGGGGNGPLGRPLNSWYLTRSIGGGHNGADMIAPQGTPIFSSAHGRVTFAGVYGGYGNIVIVDHGNGLQTYYAHCDSFNSTVGQIVERGQQIATVGTTGRSTAFHLHFEVRINGAVQDPLAWIE